MMDEQTVQNLWQDHACGDAQVGGLHERFHDDCEKFFTDYDRFRYQNERRPSACINALNVAGKQVLEIGLGEGSDSERLIRQRARWSGADLTGDSIARVRTRLTRTYKRFMHAPPLPVPRLPGETLIGSHILVHQEPIAESEQPRLAARAQERG